MTTEQLYHIFLQYPQVQTDTRKLQKGELFFALSGDKFNGNHFAMEALQKGASYAVVSEDVDPGNKQLIIVEDVLKTLQQLAEYHRSQFNIPFIAITGSNGKTTTKELVHAVLCTRYKTYTTRGNLNNHIGVPLTLLSIKKDAEIAIIEMGANHQQEIAGYCTYAMPDYGIITNCGKAHLEGFGGEAGVRKGKGELFDHLRSIGGTAFIFSDFDYLHQMSQGLKTIKYGTKEGVITGTVSKSDPYLEVQLDAPVQQIISTQLVGSYNLSNVLCAATVGHHFGVDSNAIKEALQQYAPENSRSQMVVRGTNHIVLDAYNANPTSMAVAISNFAAMQGSNKFLFLGGMMELGAESLIEHQLLVDFISKHEWNNVILVGGDFKHTIHSYLFFDEVHQAKEWYKDQHFEKTYQLIKGSRSMQMEQILPGS